MDKLEAYVLLRMEELYLKIHVGQKYNLNSPEGLTERLQDLAKYEQLKEVVRENPDWNDEEIGRKFAARIREKTEVIFD